MNTIDQLKELLQTEVELVDAMVKTLQLQQQSIIYFNFDGLNESAARQRDLLQPLQSLEDERIKLVEALIKENNIPVSVYNDEETVHISGLLDHLPPADSVEIGDLGKRLRAGAARVIELNKENERLIEHTQKYIRENVKILTDNFSKQLVDQKM